MKRFLLAASIVVSVFFLSYQAGAQGNQTVVSGSQTTAVNFPAGGCTYNWVNNTPGIGLPASGTGDISVFTAVNNGSTPVIAMITATPVKTGFAYITNSNNGTISVINIVTNKVAGTINIPSITGLSGSLAISPDGTRVYVPDALNSTISVINTATNTVTSTVSIASLNPVALSISPDGTRLYVVNASSTTVSVINTVTNTIIANILVGSCPQAIAISPDGKNVYVVNTCSNSISVINTSTNTVTATINLQFGSPQSLAVSPDGTRVYVTCRAGESLSIIDTKTNTLIAAIATYANDPLGVTVSPDGSKVYVAGQVSNDVSVINTATNKYMYSIPIPFASGLNPIGVSISPDGNSLYVVNYDSSNVSVINTSTNIITSTINVGANPNSFSDFISSGPGCNGAPVTFTITVKPSSVTPVITFTPAAGTILACQGSPSASPNVAQFTVSGTGLTNNITATAPAGFELSLSAGGVYGNTVTIPQSAGTANNTIVYVRSAASATGVISGNVVLSSSGASPQSVAVSGKVNPLPSVNTVGNQTVSAGNNTTAINFTGTAKIFNWVNDTPGIGLPAGGAGNIPAFTAVNNGNSPVTATITATPTNKQVYAYIPNTNTANVSVIDLASNKTVATIPVGRSPIGVAVSADGTKAYVTNQQSFSVSVINTVNNTLQTTIPLAAGSDPTGVVVSPDGSKIYVANYGINTVSVINTANNTLISTVAVGANPYGISISPDGSKVYTANVSDNTVSVINTSTNTVIATIPAGTGPNALCISPDGSRLYVANYNSNNVSVINAINNTLITSITTGAGASVVTLSPDGKMLYASNINGNTVSVINTANNSVVATIPINNAPYGMSVSGDGSRLYVAQLNGKTITVVNTQTNTVINTINVGLSPYAVGNFISETPGCDGPSTTFTITVNPSSVKPIITAGAATGAISACEGTASISPDIAQLTVSGNNLTNDIIATAPSGFEVSLSPANGYGASVTITQSAGKVDNITVYVRSAASATGNISGNITLASQGANSQSVAVTGKINPLPAVNPVGNQVVVSGRTTTAINFTGTASTYNWVIDNPAIGIGNGTGNIAPFIATNTGNAPLISTFTVTPINATTGCGGTPITFTIEVDPLLPANITATGTLSSLSTIYGTASTSTSFSLSGTSMNEGILVTPPAGFEVSTDNTHFSQTVAVGAAGTIAAATVYIRLTSKTPVSSYSGYITLSSLGATYVNVPVPNSVVNPAPLTVTANNVQKPSGQTLTNGIVSTGFTSSGLQNNETIGSVFMAYHEGADASAKVGTYTGSVVPSGASGGSFDPKNYTIIYKAGDIIVTEGVVNTPVAIPNAFTPNGDGINDVWNIKSLIDYPSCLVSIFTRYGSLIYQSRGYAKPWDGVYNGSPLPTGTYYYIINLQNGQPPLSGYVALIR